MSPGNVGTTHRFPTCILSFESYREFPIVPCGRASKSVWMDIISCTGPSDHPYSYIRMFTLRGAPCLSGRVATYILLTWYRCQWPTSTLATAMFTFCLAFTCKSTLNFGLLGEVTKWSLEYTELVFVWYEEIYIYKYIYIIYMRH